MMRQWMCVLLCAALMAGPLCAQVHAQHAYGSALLQAYGDTGDDLNLGSYGEYGAVRCSGGCVETFQKCAGTGIASQLPCCDSADHCVAQHAQHAECRPKRSRLLLWWWNAEVLADCITECDDGAVTFKYDSASIFYSESPPVGRFARGTAPAASEQACIEECLAHPACAVIQYTAAFPQCMLYDTAAFEGELSIVRPEARPVSTVAGVKCYYPPAICDPSKIQELTQNEEFFKLANTALDDTRIHVSEQMDPEATGREGIALECANLCALGFREASNAVRKPTNARCSGFVITDNLCTLLYPRAKDVEGGCDSVRTGQTVAFRPGVGSKVYSIADCFE